MKTQNFNDYKFRCSELGNIMGTMGLTDAQKNKLVELSDRKDNAVIGQAKALTANMESELAELIYKMNNPEFPDGLKKFLTDKWIEYEYGRYRNITSKYMDKGLKVEEKSISFYDQLTNPLGKIRRKNEVKLSNEYIQGTPDLINENSIEDVKSSWDLFTFFDSKDKVNWKYYWQIQGYLALTGKKFGVLAYVLIDTPLEIISDEQRRLMWKMGAGDNDPEYEAAKEQIERNLTFADIPNEQRIHLVEYHYSETEEQKIYERVRLCRKWVNENLYGIKTEQTNSLLQK